MSDPILVVGSVALDTIETPFTTRADVLGGAAAPFSAAASLFAPVRLVGVIGDDFPVASLDFLRQRGVDLDGLVVAPGRSFRWHGRYHLDMDHRDTVELDLGVYEGYRPELPEHYRDTPVVFLANIDPDLQLHVLGQVRAPKLTACDTIDHWITEKRAAIDELFARVDIVFLNEDEARLYADTPNLHRAAAVILARGCRAVVIKKGRTARSLHRGRGAGPSVPSASSRTPSRTLSIPRGRVMSSPGARWDSWPAARTTH